MRKFSALMVMVAMIGIMVACGGAKPAAPAPAAPAPAPAAPAPTDTAVAGSQLDFELVNATGYDIKELYLSPASSNSWEENMIPAGQTFTNGTSTKITFSGYKPEVELWDLKAVEAVEPFDAHEYKGLKLTEINKLTLNAEDAKVE